MVSSALRSLYDANGRFMAERQRQEVAQGGTGATEMPGGSTVNLFGPPGGGKAILPQQSAWR